MLVVEVTQVCYLVVIVEVLPECPNSIDVGVVEPKQGIYA